MGNCPLCRAPIKTTSASGRYNTCWSGHETHVNSVLPSVLPTIPGWICWQTLSNSGISEMRYRFWGEETTAYYKTNGESVGQELIDRYEDWMNHAYHGPRIEWELDCAVPTVYIEKAIDNIRERITNSQKELDVLQAQFEGINQ